MQLCILGADLGTSSVKLVAINLDGQVLASHRSGYAPGSQPHLRQPEALLRALATGLQALLSKTAARPAALSLSTHMHSWACLSAAGQALTDFFLWSHPLGDDSAREMREQNPALAQDIYLNTGVAIHGMTPLHKSRVWQQASGSETALFGGVKDWLFQQLTGHWCVDVSTAAATGLWSAGQQRWYPPALDWAGLQAHQLAAVVPNTFAQPLQAPFGGLPAGLPVCMGSSDGCAAMHHAQWVAPGLASLTIGSSMAARRMADQWTVQWPDQPFCYPLLNQFVLGAPGNNGGQALNWVVENLLGENDLAKGHQRLETLLQQGLRCADDAWVLPFFHGGERAPLWKPGLQAIWSEAALQLPRQAQAALAAEAIFLHASVLVNLLNLPPGQPIVLSGGVCQQEAYRQLLANALNRPCWLATEDADASAMGAALLGLQALGHHLPKPNARYLETHPQPAQRDYFQQRLRVYLAALNGLRSSFP